MKKRRLPKWNGRPELWTSTTFHNLAIVYGKQPGQVEIGDTIHGNGTFNWTRYTMRRALHMWGWQKVSDL